MVKLLPN